MSTKAHPPELKKYMDKRLQCHQRKQHNSFGGT
ncbi:hypothetical protein GBAR_LOCUS30239 [Geodia barretti]|uniref:Uncharacterized protein n=1 Tax=Geodia barretti TaxID=519541 RepID=A0AA35XE22_GEOBA|nr:hypothetical protein GBAR_LOCUS30239 [Geodia barretti]